MSAHDLIAALDRGELTEQIAEALYLATRDAASVLFWDDLPGSLKEEHRARAREAVRSCLPYAVTAARVQVAHALATEDGHAWDDLGATSRARYRSKAIAACTRYRQHLAETAYPEDIERKMGDAFSLHGQSLRVRADETRVLGSGLDWRARFAEER